MTTIATRRMVAVMGVLGVAVMLAMAPRAQAQNHTPQTLVERQEILDQITRYYYNILNPDPQSFRAFYTADGELVLGTRSYKGDWQQQIVVQAREYATWEKVNGKWLYKKRNIFAGTKHPEWWKE